MELFPNSPVYLHGLHKNNCACDDDDADVDVDNKNKYKKKTTATTYPDAE